jgi:hypothetical protein
MLVIRKEGGNIELNFKATIEFETCLMGKCYLKYSKYTEPFGKQQLPPNRVPSSPMYRY